MSKLIELRARYDAKAREMDQIFDLAGPTYDLEKVSTLDGDIMAKAKEIKRRNEELADLDNQIKALADVEDIAAKFNHARAENAKPTSRPHIGGTGEKSEFDPMIGFKSAGEFFATVRRAEAKGAVPDARLITDLKAASGLNESNPSDGGWLVPPQVSNEMLRRVYDTGVLASRVRRIPITSNSLKINAIDESSRANGSRWGGIQAYWEGEAEAYTGARPKFRQMQLALKKLTGLCYATDELMDDANALASVISQGFEEEFGFKVDDAILNGTGAGQPAGILNSASLVSVSKETGQAAATIVPENLVKMWSRCWGRSRRNAVWLINQDIEPQLHTMGMEFGIGGGQLVYMPAGGLSGEPFGTLFGRPVIPVEQAATLGTVGDIVLADLSQYLWVDKGPVTPSSSVHVRFLYDEMTFKFTYRADGQSVWNSALTPKNGSATLSPFVALATRS